MSVDPVARWLVTCTAAGQPTLSWRLPAGDFVIGREPGCSMVLPGRRLSRRHARLHVGPPGPALAVEDLRSFNGTYVDGNRVVTQGLRGGECVALGEWELRLRPAAWADAAAPLARPGAALADEWDRENTGKSITAEPPVAPARPAPPLPLAREVAPATGPWTPLQAPPPLRHPSPSAVPRPMGGAWTPAAVRTRSGAVPRVDLRWQGSAGPADSVRERSVQDSPLVRRVTQHAIPLVAGGLGEAGEFAALAQDRDSTQELALRLVYRVAAELQAAQGEEDFLAHMADTLAQAVRAQGVVILMSPEGASPAAGAADLVPKVARQSGNDGAGGGVSRTVVEQALARRAAVATEDAQRDARFSAHSSVMDLDLRAVLAVPMLRQEGPVGVIYLTRLVPFSDSEQDLAAALAHLTTLGVERARLKEQVAEELALRQTLERFHTPEVVEKLMQKQAAQGQGPHLFLETITATVLFCDLCGFTSYCDAHAPDDVAALLNGYLGEMTRVVYEFHGTVDKYIGDAVMAVFGAPFPAADDSVRAARCALAMQEAFQALMAARPPAERLQLRVGLNTGTVVAGTVGSPLRMEYTCLGDAVNVAQRLESIAAPGQVLAGRSTADAIAHELAVRPCGPAALKGKSGAVETFEVLGERDGEEPPPDEPTAVRGAAT